MWYHLDVGGNFTNWSLYIFTTYMTYECMDVNSWLDNEQHQLILHILCIFSTLYYQTIHPYMNNYHQLVISTYSLPGIHLYIFIINNYQSIITSRKQHCFVKHNSHIDEQSFTSWWPIYYTPINHWFICKLSNYNPSLCQSSSIVTKSSIFKYLTKSRIQAHIYLHIIHTY